MPLSLDGTGSITGIVTVSVSDDLGHVGDTNTKIKFPADDTIAFDTAGSERIRISSNGLVTFYGTNEQDLIYITTGNAAGNTFANIRGDNEAGIRIRGGGSYDGGTIELAGGLRNSDPGLIKFSTGTGSSVSERLRITSDGKVGIGITNPTGNLHISSGTSGDCELIIEADTDNNDEDDNPRIVFKQDGGQEESSVGMDNNTLILANSVSSSGGIVFKTGTATGYTNATERVRITSSGYVGINTNNPLNALEVLGKSSNTDTIAGVTVHEIARFNADTSEKHGLKLALDNTNKVFYFHRSDNGGDFAVSMRSGGQSLERLRILANGNIGIGTNNPTQIFNIYGTNLKPVIGDRTAHTPLYSSYDGQNNTSLEITSSGTGTNVAGLTINNPTTAANTSYKTISFSCSGTSSSEKRACIIGSNHDEDGSSSLKGNFYVSTNNGSGLQQNLQINHDGHVTKPNQPCAVVYQCTGPAGGAANDSSDNDEPLHFDHVHINQGGMIISQNNGRIQVPVTGIYFVSYMVSGTVTNVDDNDGIELILLRNGSEYPAGNSGAEPVFNFGLTANREEFFCNNTLLVSLTKDDYVEVALDNIGNSDGSINRGNFNVMLMA